MPDGAHPNQNQAGTTGMKVLIIGAGIAGPILAMLLQHKGFSPEVFEKHSHPTEGGLTIMVSPQSLKVLDLVGLAHKVISLGRPLERLLSRSEPAGRVFIDSSLPSTFAEKTGWPMVIVNRTVYHKFLVDSCAQRGIPVRWGKKLVDVKQEGEKVTALFADGAEEEGDLLVGCDGLHSNVRDALFGKTPASFTGLVSVSGFTPFKNSLQPPHTTMLQIFGDSGYFLTFPTAQGKNMWAVNVAAESGDVEDWGPVQESERAEIVQSLPPSTWSGEPSLFLQNADEMVRFGLYLRPIPEVWHKGRVVLCGDAAHPITPFLGQGANQASEDIYHLVRVLVQHKPLTADSLDKAFKEYTTIRKPKVTLVVDQSNREAGQRIVKGEEACRRRDEKLAEGLESDTWKTILENVKGPYEAGKSEV
ncbi:FAD/NAD(P)-binding domain-containing protein [Calocera viscosa TUFC12733]|uniref:FAD/NAD(P)-binding domain-containing protein n=1 Tax=Calocera viscosa (strain TUFC12733) TaxID=1330018 RepID=A0A167JDJ3_CALVF|nr:FAD/NAD(P)-binding domain-containing protein [Calocera viscosa TUFC12733]